MQRKVTSECDRVFVGKLINTRPEHWTPALIMAAQSLLRQAYKEDAK